MQEEILKKYANIGERLQNFRQTNKISQKELAELLGFSSQVSISKIEAGNRALTIDSLLKLKSIFRDLDLHWLITGEKSPEAIQARKQLFQILGTSLTNNTEAGDYLQHLIDTTESILSSGEIKGPLKTQYIQYLEQLRSTKQLIDKQIDNSNNFLLQNMSASMSDVRRNTSAE